jgi:putative glutamine amidotransferase
MRESCVMPASRALPLVGLPSDTHEASGLVYHSIGDKYLRAVAEAARCAPVMLPSLGDGGLIEATLDRLDGVVMTGATSNVHPPRYGSRPTVDHEPYDHSRDAATLSLIPRVLARGMPLLCICRGYQELNVVLGGTLETEVQRGVGRLDHRAPPSDDLDIRYGPAHDVTLTPGGRLEAILGKPAARVNTVHRQAIARLADGLAVEARAPDGVIEAVSVKGATGFALGVQWHPEYKAAQNPDSVKLFEAFAAAARAYGLARDPASRTNPAARPAR